MLLDRGYSAKDITMFAYDDIVNNEMNVFPGQIFHSLDHKVNQYPGSDSINYKECDVDCYILYRTLTGLPSTSEDYVFVYYDNHGGDGFLGVPVLCGEFIDGNKLRDCFNTMGEKNMYKGIFFTIEACYAGSVAKLIDAPRMAILTASNDHESSYAAVYDESVGAFLSNQFTDYWISKVEENPTQTIGELYEYLEGITQGQHTCYYGDESLQSLTIDKFIGIPKTQRKYGNDHSSNKLTLASQSEATEISLRKISENHPKPTIRAKARLQLLSRKVQTQKLDTVLDLLVKNIDSQNYDKIMNKYDAPTTQEYFDLLHTFFRKFGIVNPDDYGKFRILKNLAAEYPKSVILRELETLL